LCFVVTCPQTYTFFAPVFGAADLLNGIVQIIDALQLQDDTLEWAGSRHGISRNIGRTKNHGLRKQKSLPNKHVSHDVFFCACFPRSLEK